MLEAMTRHGIGWCLSDEDGAEFYRADSPCWACKADTLPLAVARAVVLWAMEERA